MGKIKDMPVGEQPYEKCKRFGPEILTDSELLAVFIRTGTGNKSPIDIAMEVIKTTHNGNLAGLIQMRYEDFTGIKGIGDVKAVQLLCLAELSKRISRQHAAPVITLDNPESIANYYMEKLRHIGQEQVWVCLFDTKCNLLSDKMISSGTVNASLVSPREILIYALEKRAVRFVLIHNHPSGDPTPSADDVELTKRISEAGMCVNIQMIDHIIIGDCAYTSLREVGIIS